MAKDRPDLLFERIDSKGAVVKYPAWRYHAFYEPMIVNNLEEDEKAAREGYYKADAPITAHQGWNNWYHDLEDMNCRQLCYFARAEYGAILPEEAPKAKLLRALWQLAVGTQKTKGRVVLLAQSMRMNLDETHREILRMAGDLEKCDEVEVKEIWL